MRKKIKILGVNFDNITEKEVLEKITNWLSPKHFFNIKRYIVTPNPEIVLKTLKDEKYRKIINKAALSVPDGTGILWASRFKKTPLPERITGVDLMKEICKIAAKNGNKVFLLGAEEGVAIAAANKLKKLYPKLKISGTYSGSPNENDEYVILDKIEKPGTEILFVAFGAPAQELWIERNYKRISTLKLAIGVGGAFDFISGKTQRAPKFMREHGLEWAYRLYKQPSRVKRIWNATVKFPIKVLKNK